MKNPLTKDKATLMSGAVLAVDPNRHGVSRSASGVTMLASNVRRQC
ncbi:MAG: hypothetical protein AAF664_12465 [Planctomycetota bacterium]